ncbi:hypothetical protein [Flammeovirga agarivorans]|uniref:Uncharacterized protein n=1 Tax=Flammeovirga agarivorans TaxID=2726742 RepID=A0A7X8XZC3_9BACT|nr:hypothetical protein [Flammeovirga agarivorans]NLR94850.1 hypothetical protein [Flammeovirga agarivorans]
MTGRYTIYGDVCAGGIGKKFPHWKVWGKLCLALSSQTWRKKNGRVVLHTDDPSKFDQELFDEIDTTWYEDFKENSKDIDTNTFWACGKLFAYKKASKGDSFIDADFIFWDKYPEKFKRSATNKINLTYVHADNGVYTGANAGIGCNAAFITFWDEEHLKEYIARSIAYMKKPFYGDRSWKGKNPIDPFKIIEMCYAEQGIMYETFTELGRPKEMFLENMLRESRQTSVTHIWGLKRIIENDYKQALDLVDLLYSRLLQDFPDKKSLWDSYREEGIEQCCSYFMQ